MYQEGSHTRVTSTATLLVRLTGYPGGVEYAVYLNNTLLVTYPPLGICIFTDTRPYSKVDMWY